MRFDKLDYVLITIALVLSFASGGILAYYGFPRIVKEEVIKYSEPVTVYVDRIVPEIKTVTEYVTLPPEIQYVTKTEYVEKPVKEIVTIKKELVDFPDKETLVAWVDNNSNFAVLTMDISGNVNLNSMNCISYSRGMQYSAEKDGYRVNQQIVIDGKLNGFKVTDVMGGHVICLTEINGDYFAIEPQTGQVTFVGEDENNRKRRAVNFDLTQSEPQQ